jgi:hypothetical protein
LSLSPRSLEGEDTFVPPLRSGREALDEHLARGDIAGEEYVDRRKGLEQAIAMA